MLIWNRLTRVWAAVMLRYIVQWAAILAVFWAFWERVGDD